MSTQTAEEKSLNWAATLDEISVRANGGLSGWAEEARARAIEHFKDRGFPTTDEEDWKYTNVAPIARGGFNPALTLAPKELDAASVEPFIYEESRKSLIVFVNGRFNEKLSNLEALPEGVVAKPIAEALTDGDGESLRARFERNEGLAADRFVALNTAFISQGILLRISKGRKAETPIQLLYLSTAGEERAASFPHVLISAERESSATIIESFASLGDSQYFTNAVADLHVGEGARLVHYLVQRESESAFHVAATRAELSRSASYDLTTITLGARLSRHNVEVRLEDEGAECWVDGLYLLGAGQHADTHSLIDHRAPHCTSHQNYKGILEGKSRAVFNGRVFVHKDAQQTDAFQSNKNLLLSPEARVDTKPQLEIFADDVKCAHGATVGQLEEEELFYLLSRGLKPNLARNLLTYGFAEEVVQKIGVASIKKQLDEAIINRLHADFEA